MAVGRLTSGAPTSGPLGAEGTWAGPAAAGRAGAAGAAPPARAASSCSTRAASPSALESPATEHTRTKATSRSILGSGAWRMSTSDLPIVSRLRVMMAGERRDANSSDSARSDSDRRAGAAPIFNRKADRSASTKVSPIRRGSIPRVVAASIARRASPASCDASASSKSGVELSASETPPAATTWSSAERVSRAEPPPTLTT